MGNLLKLSMVVRRSAIRTELWQRERGFSLIFGRPCSTLDSQILPLIPNNNPSDLQNMRCFLRQLGIVMGHIVARDQDPSGKAYLEMLKIEEEFDRFRILYQRARHGDGQSMLLSS